MYQFAVLALLGLGTLKVVDLVSELVPSLAKARTLATFVVGIAAAVTLDYSMFGGFGVAVREAWLGTAVTGLIVGALAAAWETVLGCLGATGAAEATRRGDSRPRIAA